MTDVEGTTDMTDGEPITRGFCDERHKNLKETLDAIKGDIHTIEKDVKDVKMIVGSVSVLQQRMDNHEKSHDKGWSKGAVLISVVMAVIALSALVVTVWKT